MQDKELLEKINALSPEQVAEVVNFVDFLTQRDRVLVTAASKTAEQPFSAVWENPDDAEYDKL